MLPSDAVLSVLHEFVRDLHGLCDGERTLKVDLDCSGAASFVSEALPAKSIFDDVTFGKAVVNQGGVRHPASEDAPPICFPTFD